MNTIFGMFFSLRDATKKPSPPDSAATGASEVLLSSMAGFRVVSSLTAGKGQSCGSVGVC